jgi:hypothetical protein
MTNILEETIIPLQKAARLIPPGRNGKATHIGTILRWILNGSKGPSGGVIRLEAVRLGGRWVTSREALARFAARLTPALGEAPAAPRTPGRRQRASERAEKELEKCGI